MIGSTSGNSGVNFKWKSNENKAVYKEIFIGGLVSHDYSTNFNVTKEITYTLRILNATKFDA